MEKKHKNWIKIEKKMKLWSIALRILLKRLTSAPGRNFKLCGFGVSWVWINIDLVCEQDKIFAGLSNFWVPDDHFVEIGQDKIFDCCWRLIDTRHGLITLKKNIEDCGITVRWRNCNQSLTYLLKADISIEFSYFCLCKFTCFHILTFISKS